MLTMTGMIDRALPLSVVRSREMSVARSRSDVAPDGFFVNPSWGVFDTVMMQSVQQSCPPTRLSLVCKAAFMTNWFAHACSHHGKGRFLKLHVVNVL